MQRNENESFEDFKIRRAASNKAMKALKRGVLFWNSYFDGTYHNPEKRALQAQRKARKASRNKVN